MTTQFYLKSSKRTIPIEVQYTDTGLIFWEPNRPDVVLEIAANNAGGLLSTEKHFGGGRKMDVLQMTPLDVVEYFEQSPVLYSMAADVRATLIGSQAARNGRQQDLQLLQDVAAIEHLCDPIKADIAEVLLGTRYYAGSNADRITKAFNAFYSSSTHPKTQETQVEETKAA